ncbi:hypothetical protein BGZ65_003979 [Modicella reniformis]|uniref:Uncharacterized protein n=1 Tax=Modicella reniformis TaxID=1440133 RepID=A0A9P6IZE3_9FUNG|nr:hypothetical protein BGZ65_003979 [Modicella reniformis]
MSSLQAFRINNNSPVLYIQSLQDTKTDRRIVLWTDVLLAFRNAGYIRHGMTLVPFMKDENFEDVQPLRIEYHPNMTLEVILMDSDTASIATSDGTLGSFVAQETSLLPARQFDSRPNETKDTRITKDHSWEKATLGVGVVIGTAIGAPIVVTGGAAAAFGVGIGGILASLVGSTMRIPADVGGIMTDKEDRENMNQKD